MSANDTTQLIRRLELLRALHELNMKTQFNVVADDYAFAYWKDSSNENRVDCQIVEKKLVARADEGDPAAIAWLNAAETKSQPPAYVVPIYDDPDDLP